MELILNKDIIIYIIKILFIIFFSIISIFKIRNIKQKLSIPLIICICIISIICGLIKSVSNSLNSIMILILLVSIVITKKEKNSMGYAIIITTISLSINYILFFISACVSYIPKKLVNIENNYINLIFIIIIYSLLIHAFFKMGRFKHGIESLQRKFKNEYFDVFILNISITILFITIIMSNYKIKLTGNLIFGLIVSAIIMLITIQKSLELYYKQKLLIQDLEETKKELEDKKLEIEKLEKENLNFSKVSHSIAHKQKSLEHKLNELMLKNETASEIDIRDRINAISKEMQPRQAKELSKTDIIEIDDMLKYMQAECINDKIEFELQISGNIYQMINNHIRKEDLEILLADHIKNAIIAINHSDNSNKSILVRLGIIDGCYSLYIYDSGIEFEIDTLEKLGKVPSTTHKESGGTGMGFMNTFDTLKKYNASMIINEYGKPSKDNYTKVLMIKFDKKNEFKIISYRSEEIENKCNSEDINVEKLIINQN